MTRCLGCMNEYDGSLGMCPHCGYVHGSEEIRDEHLYPGTFIADGRYEVGKALGFGGFGVTYIGFDTLMEKKVAIKEYLPGEFSTRSTHQSQIKVYGGDKTEQFNLGMSKFVDEAKKLAKMNVEAGVVDVYDAFRENGTAYIVMEYLDGETLKEKVDREGKISPEEAEKILLPVFASIQKVHDIGIIHRDIAPDNIFITKDGKVKLLDFGAARFASATHSRSLTVIYKPGYSPEEQYESHGNQGPWTDVYALAATFYKCITGITPDTSLERRVKDTLKKPSELGISISKNKETALLNALNISIEKRTQSATQFIEEYNSDGKVKRIIEKFAKLDIGRLSLKAKIGIAAASVAVVVGASLVAILNPFKALSKDSVEVPDGQTRVPMFVNETLDSAKLMATESNIVLKQSDIVYSTEIPKGRVLSQSVNAGNFINLEGVVEYVTSGGVKQIYVPEVSGTTEEDARQMLKNSGFQHISVEYEYSDDVAPGNIIGLRLTPGGPIVEKETNVDEGTAIIIVVSKGMDPSKIDNTVKFTVGNYVGKTLEEVQKEVSGYAGIYVDASEQKYTGKNDAGVILEQKTAAGTELSAGEENNNTVYLVVSKGIDYRRVPDIVVGKKYKDVVKELEAAGFTLGDIKSVYSKDMAAECVVSFADESGKALKEGQQLPAGTKIILTVNDAALAPTNTPTPTATPIPTKKPFIQPKATDTPTPMPTPTPTPCICDYEYYSTERYATCEEGGVEIWKCRYCGNTTKQRTPETGHTIAIDAATSNSCTESGLTEGKHCSVCGKIIVAQTTVDAKGHTEVTDAAKAPTCTENGLTEGKHCSVCNAVIIAQEIIPATGHTEVVDARVEPDCTKSGITEGKHCSVCGAVIVAQEEIKKLGHTYSSDSDPDCDRCGHLRYKQYTLSFDANGGSCSESSRSVYENNAYGGLPTPTREYYTFAGWYTSPTGGSVVSGSTLMSAGGATVYAHWTENPISDWVSTDSVPAGATVLETRWLYDETHFRYTNAGSPGSEWIQNGSQTKTKSTGYHYYADYPSGFNTSDSLYSKYNKGPLSSSGNMEVRNSELYSYIYWHWAYNVADGSVDNRPIGSYYNELLTVRTNTGSTVKLYTNVWSAFESSNNYPASGGSCKYNAGSGTISYWWWQLPVYRQYYIERETRTGYYKISKDVVSATEVSAREWSGESNSVYNDEFFIKNVRKQVKYRAK